MPHTTRQTDKEMARQGQVLATGPPGINDPIPLTSVIGRSLSAYSIFNPCYQGPDSYEAYGLFKPPAGRQEAVDQRSTAS